MIVRTTTQLLMSANLLLGLIAPAQAQLVVEHHGLLAVRGFHGKQPFGVGIRRSFQSDTEANAEFNRILTAVGLNWISDRIVLRATADTANAEAGITTNGERFIFYNATFMQQLKQKTAEQWSVVSVLAHELGHHLAFHTELSGSEHKYELEADYFSGFVLRRLGASLDQSHTAMRNISSKLATLTHPALEQRLQVITVGWTDGGSLGAPSGLKERVPQQPAVSTTTGHSALSPQRGAEGEQTGYAAAFGKYNLPIGADINAFVRCLGSRAVPVFKDKDYRVEEMSSIIRAIIPLAREDVVSAAFEQCRVSSGKR